MWKKIIIPTIVLASLGMVYVGQGQGKSDLKSMEVNNIGEGHDPIVVLELFTSQGCSSCPPADKLLAQVKNEFPNNVFALSYHVDYWNRLGWKDPYSSNTYSKRQMEYNKKFHSSNYTPQMVVNGQDQFVGSDKSKMYDEIRKYQQQKSHNTITLSDVKLANGKIQFAYKVFGGLDKWNLRAVLVLGERTTQVKNGENRDRTLVETNIVVAELQKPLGSGQGTLLMDIPDLVNPKEKMELMVFVEDNSHDVMAAAKSRLDL